MKTLEKEKPITISRQTTLPLNATPEVIEMTKCRLLSWVETISKDYMKKTNLIAVRSVVDYFTDDNNNMIVIAKIRLENKA